MTPTPRSAPWMFFLAITLACIGSSTAAHPNDATGAPLSLSLSQAVALALRQAPAVQQAREKLGEAGATRRMARGHLGPKLSVEANVFRWNGSVAFNLPPPSPAVLQAHADVFLKYPDLFAALPDVFAFGPIRETLTSQVTVTLAQPLTPLYTILKGHRIATLGEAAARDGLTAAQQAAIFDATRAYIGLKQVRSAVAIAQTAVEQVTAHVRRAQNFHSAGMIGRHDLLKAEVGLAQARERLIQAQAGEALAQSALALALGLPPEQAILPAEEFSDPPPALGRGLEHFVNVARAGRPELKAVSKQIAMAEAGRDIARWALVPQVSAVASYQHSEGLGFLMPKDAFFAGGVLRWEVWEWGAKYYGISEAEHRARQARLGARQLADGVYLEVKRAFLDLSAAEQTLLVARGSLAVAEESFRLEQARFDKNVNTSTDVLDAQLAATRAKLSYSTALHQWYTARAALAKATGQWHDAASPPAPTAGSRPQPERAASTAVRSTAPPRPGASATHPLEATR